LICVFQTNNISTYEMKNQQMSLFQFYSLLVFHFIYWKDGRYKKLKISHSLTDHIPSVIVTPIKYSVNSNHAISQYISQHFTFYNVIFFILRHYGERVGIHSCKCVHQMGASKRVQIQRTEPHRLLAIYSPAFYVAHHIVGPIACWQIYTTLTTFDCTQHFYHCCTYELAQRLLKLKSKQLIHFLF
jgi:hypothetical protein